MFWSYKRYLSRRFWRKQGKLWCNAGDLPFVFLFHNGIFTLGFLGIYRRGTIKWKCTRKDSLFYWATRYNYSIVHWERIHLWQIMLVYWICIIIIYGGHDWLIGTHQFFLSTFSFKIAMKFLHTCRVNLFEISRICFCFVGVGKTSIARSIARALNRNVSILWLVNWSHKVCNWLEATVFS